MVEGKNQGPFLTINISLADGGHRGKLIIVSIITKLFQIDQNGNSIPICG